MARWLIISLLGLHGALGFGLTPTRLARAVGSGQSSLRMVGEGAADYLDLDGTGVRVAIVKARWNEEVCDSLVEGCRSTLTQLKVQKENIFETSVPGSFELPLAARFLALSGTADVIITVGCLIDGETTHFDVISNAVAKGLMDVGLQTATPVVFGVLTCKTMEQAIARSSATAGHNHGEDWAKTAVEMALLRNSALGKFKQGTLGFNVNAESKSSTPAPGKLGF